MKLLKILLVFFLIYFIRRFIQFYKVMKEIQAGHEKTREEARKSEAVRRQEGVIDADFKVIKDN